MSVKPVALFGFPFRAALASGDHGRSFLVSGRVFPVSFFSSRARVVPCFFQFLVVHLGEFNFITYS